MSTLPSNNITNTIPRDSDYEWRYEYYEDDEPVSFEGLKANRCKLVIHNIFWCLQRTLLNPSDCYSLCSIYSDNCKEIVKLEYTRTPSVLHIQSVALLQYLSLKTPNVEFNGTVSETGMMDGPA